MTTSTSTTSSSNNMTFLHLSYLHQVSDLLEDQHKPLAARLNFIAKKISSKHQVHVRGADPPKSTRCKACQAPITSDCIKTEKKRLMVRCDLCGFKRHFSNSQSDNKKKETRNKNKNQE